MIARELIEQKEEQYKDYIDEHRQLLKFAFEMFIKRINKGTFWLDEKELQMLTVLVEIHDNVKFSDNEFHGYRNKYYPAAGEEIVENVFKQAWLHHQNSCPHHLEYWQLRRGEQLIPLDMPRVYILEMLLDWQALGMKFENSSEWYWQQNKGKFRMTEKTREEIEKWVVLFK